MTNLILTLIRVALQLIVVTGIIMGSRYFISGISYQISRRQELKDNIFKNKAAVQLRVRRLRDHIENMMILANKDFEVSVSYHRFIFTSILFAVAVFISFYFAIGNIPNQLTNNPFSIDLTNDVGNAASWRVSLIFSVITLFTPYLILRFRYLKAFTKASYDLMEPVKFMTKYSHLSVHQALIETAKILPDHNVLKLPIRQLSMSYISYRNEEELVNANNRFALLVGTTFASQFINNLMYAEREGSRTMKNDFQILHKAMEIQRETILEVKANSRDAVQMGLYINLFVFLALTGTLMFFLRPSVYLKFQFETAIGLTLFTLITLSYVFSVLFSIGLSRPKLDY